MISKPKRHHYLPESYLRRFCDGDGVLHVYDRKGRRFFPTTPTNLCVEGHYYAVEQEDGTRDTAIETFLSQVEGRADPVIAKLLARQAISSEEKGDLAVFLAMLFSRIPAFKRTVEASVEAAVRQFTTRLVRSKGFRDEHFLETDAKGVDREDAEAALNLYEDGKYGVDLHRNFSLKAMMDIAPRVADALCERNWVTFQCPDRVSFIATDTPITILPPPDCPRDNSVGVGIETPGAVKKIPLGPHMLLSIFDKGGRFFEEKVQPSMVRSLNTFIAPYCERFLFGRSEKLVRSVVKRSGIHVLDAPDRMAVEVDGRFVRTRQLPWV